MEIKLEKLSKHRRFVMGIAIMIVFYFHSEISFPEWLGAMNYLRGFFIGGVDIFLFLSGMGLYFSYSKNSNLAVFYKKRVFRILPTYWSIVIVGGTIGILNGTESIKSVLIYLSTIGFWFNKYVYDWDIPAQLLLYALFPMFFYVIYKTIDRKVALALLICVVFLIIYSSIQMNGSYLLIFLVRVPNFLFGLYIGHLAKNKYELSSRSKSILLISYFVGVVLLLHLMYTTVYSERWYYGLGYYPFIFMAVPFALFIGAVGHELQRLKLYNWISFVGGLSLEVYLIHSKVFALKYYLRDWLSPIDKYHYIEHFIYLFITLVLAYSLQVMLNKLLYSANSKKETENSGESKSKVLSAEKVR